MNILLVSQFDTVWPTTVKVCRIIKRKLSKTEKLMKNEEENNGYFCKKITKTLGILTYDPSLTVSLNLEF